MVVKKKVNKKLAGKKGNKNIIEAELKGFLLSIIN